MQDRPTAAELLHVLQDFLEHDVMQELSGPLQFRVRVAANIAGILEREALHGERLLEEERELLSELLSELLAQHPLGATKLLAQVQQLNAHLVNELDVAPSQARTVAIWQALMQIAKSKLSIARPGYDSYDARAEVQ